MPDSKSPHFILASASPRRLQLLQQLGLTPDDILPANVDETPLKTELPDAYALRIASAKAALTAEKNPASIILAADTVVAAGRRILPKAEDEKTARACLALLSGRRHRVYTAISVGTRSKLVMTQVRFSRLNKDEIEAYIATGEWHGKAGGYAIQGAAAAFIPFISGSYSNVVGLPLAETSAMLKQAGLSW